MVKLVSVNTQGMSRQDESLMSCILSEEGYTTVSIDLVSGEPTIIAHYSGDKNYIYAAFEGAGKPAYYNESGLLMLDDIYLMLASVNPVSKDRIKEAFNDKYNGVIGFDQWAIDKEVIKKQIKPERKSNKIAALGLGYGMGARTLVNSMFDQGAIISLKDAKQAVYNYWNVLFPDVGKLRDFLTLKVEREGHLINPFGFRMTPEPHKALNYFIQSSVNGIIDILIADFFEVAPWCKFRTIIHDEIIVDIPDDRLGEGKKLFLESVDRLNKMLGWSVDVRTGWAQGKEWYTAH